MIAIFVASQAWAFPMKPDIKALLDASQAWAFPMKPDIKALLDQAKQPQPHYVPARAGWNGPEDKSAVVTVNPTYEELRKQPSAAELRQDFLSAAIPDWRVLLAIAALIVGLRVTKRQRRGPKAKVLEFPATLPVGSAVQDAA